MLNKIFTWAENATEPFPAQIPEKPPAGFFAFIAHYAKPFYRLLIICGVLSMMVAMLDVVMFAFVGSLVDWLTASGKESFWEQHKYSLIGMAVLVLVVSPALRLCYEICVHQGLLGNFAMRTRWQAHRYLLRQGVEFFQNDFAGRVATKMMQTALGVRDSVLRMTEVFVYVIVYFTGAVILFAVSDLRLTAPMIVWLLSYIVILRIYIPKLRDISMQQSEARSAVIGRVVDSYTNITTVKMFAHADYEDNYAREGMQGFLDNVYIQMRLSTELNMLLTVMNALLLFSVAGTSIWLWSENAVSTGAIAFATGLVLRMQGMSQWILWEVSGLFENVGVVQDGIETIARDRTIVDTEEAAPLIVCAGKITFETLGFNYGKHRSDIDKGVIDKLSLTIASGEKVGIVGRSGAGKSTLVSLLLRFYDLEHGRILIDDQDIARVTQDSLRSQISMVTQDTSLLHRSVLDNIRYGVSNAARERVIEAAKQAKAHDFIVDLQDFRGRRGYDAHVGERGVKLSGGQRQRIAIARVLLKNAPIVILDEATSALDSEVESAIHESFDNVMQNKTVIAIAHRLSTIAAMDRLIIMDNGQIIEQGSHHELLRAKGLYSRLWMQQSGGFLDLGQPEHKVVADS